MPSGIGGNLIIPLTTVTVRVEEWTIDKAIESDDTTDTGSEGWRDREALIKDATGTMNVIYRVGEAMEDVSLDIGDEAYIQFRLGSTGQMYAGLVHIKSVNVTNPGKGNAVIRQRCQWEHKEGGILGPVAVPAADTFVQQGIERLMKREAVLHGAAAQQRDSYRSARSDQPERADVPRESPDPGRLRDNPALGQKAPQESASGSH